MHDERTGCRFVTRLAETYTECIQAIEGAVAADAWDDVGVLSGHPPTKKRKPASYRCFETTVTLYGRVHRALVVHSDALDKREIKKLDRAIHDDLTQLARIKAQQNKISTHKGRMLGRRSIQSSCTILRSCSYRRQSSWILKRVSSMNVLFQQTPGPSG